VSLRYPIVLHKSEEGYEVDCPALPGCWSQGATEDEAVENIRDAIREYLAAIRNSAPTEAIREVEVTV
jgi:predicted RNase H-like HicB family nuclease